MKKKVLLFSSMLLIAMCSTAQEHQHTHGRNEIGISPGVIYAPSHHSWGFGLHAHYFRTLADHSPWALGVGIEQVFSHGSHWTISAGGKYALMDKLNIAVMPGITFFRHKADEHTHDVGHKHGDQAQFSMHFELSYDLLHTDHFHFGPAIDYSWTSHDAHFMLGIHCAYSF